MSGNTFDEQLRERVIEDFGENKGKELASAYEQAQSRLQKDVYPNISGAEPNLSDHGINHILNVQRNVIQLLSDDGEISELSGIELYCLLCNKLGG